VVKKFGEKGYCKALAKKTLANQCWLVLPIAPHWLILKQSRTKQFQTSMNMIKRTPYFPFVLYICHVLVACCLMMARWTVQSIIRGYHQYISKLSLESELANCCDSPKFFTVRRGVGSMGAMGAWAPINISDLISLSLNY